MFSHPSAPLLCQLAMVSLSAPSVAAATYTCESVVFRAEVYADEAISINVLGDDVKKHCDFRIEDDGPLGEVSCDVVDVLAQVHAPKQHIIGVFESGYEKICQFSINGSLRSASADATEVPEQAASFEDGVQAALAYLHGIQEYALAAAQHDAERVRSASVQILDRPADFIGSDVVNDTGQALGELSAFAINNSDNSLYAVLEVGGFLGIGTSEIALNLNQLRLNKSRQLMIEGTTSDQLKMQGKYTASDYERVDLADVMEQGIITTIPTSSPLAYLFASSNLSKGQESKEQNDLMTLHGQVNKYHAQLATCLYRFYAGLPVAEGQGEFSCIEDEEGGQLEISIELGDESKYRLVVFKQG